MKINEYINQVELMYVSDRAHETHKIQNSKDVYELFKELEHSPQEKFVVAPVDTRNNVLNYSILFIGSSTESLVSPRHVAQVVLGSNASHFLMVHNHPSGDCYPSQPDTKITKRIRDAMKLLGIHLMDHIIVGKDCYYSFADEGTL
jgi:DNA repair protein RadC